MDLKEIVLYFVVVCSSFAEAIRCKCTKESETVSCIDGVCEMEPGYPARIFQDTMLKFSLPGLALSCAAKNWRPKCTKGNKANNKRISLVSNAFKQSLAEKYYLESADSSYSKPLKRKNERGRRMFP
ncbi:hypothetical protein ANCCEY_06361 [Ancylostoma ceylanicum]|uniref:Uncharacterized protein n=1 Tax=Ancylostoma ceylanicum TaxID=53326 RepID=A0A0D6LRP1_9BILA|nr:hypothetical protein ANCCEY_06361 [Ancylostoma ceylanicum]